MKVLIDAKTRIELGIARLAEHDAATHGRTVMPTATAAAR